MRYNRHMKSEPESPEEMELHWRREAKRFLKAELKRQEVTYEELSRRLSRMGLDETPGAISMKIHRGTYPVWFLLAVFEAIGIELRVVPLSARCITPTAEVKTSRKKGQS